MDYEKQYKEALERASKLIGQNPFDTVSQMMEHVFPELKESEDKRVKRILYSITNKMSFHLSDIFTEEEFQCFDAWANAWLEKQGELNTLWHDATEEPEEMREVFCEWESSDATWHDIAFYHTSTKSFMVCDRRIDGVVKWAYVNEILKK